MKEIQANTFTPLYDEVEDRLRVVINYNNIQSRVDFMITRSFVIKLIPSADEFMMKHYVDEDAFDNIKVSTPRNENKAKQNLSPTDEVNLELYRTDEQLLSEVNFSYDANTKFTSLTFSSKQTSARAVLDFNMLEKVFGTIKDAIPNFAWGISGRF